MANNLNFWAFFGFLFAIILLTNPFSTTKKGVTVDILSEYQKFNENVNNELLSPSEKLSVAEEYVFMSKQMLKHDKFDKAIDAINNAISLAPTYENIYNNLASIYISRALYNNHNNISKAKESRDFMKAINFAEKNIQTFPNSSKKYSALLSIYLLTEDYKNAVNISQNICLSQPFNKNHCKKVADLYLLQNKKLEAIDFYNSLIKSTDHEDQSWLYNKIGNIYFNSGNCIEANKFFKKAYKILPTSENFIALKQSCTCKISPQ